MSERAQKLGSSNSFAYAEMDLAACCGDHAESALHVNYNR